MFALIYHRKFALRRSFGELSKASDGFPPKMIAMEAMVQHHKLALRRCFGDPSKDTNRIAPKYIMIAMIQHSKFALQRCLGEMKWLSKATSDPLSPAASVWHHCRRLCSRLLPPINNQTTYLVTHVQTFLEEQITFIVMALAPRFAGQKAALGISNPKATVNTIELCTRNSTIAYWICI